MKKYNFFDLKADVKKGKKLPEDVNKPIHEFLVSNGLESVSEILKKKEQKTQCGDINVYSIKNPAVRIELKTNYGMVEGYDTFTKTIIGDLVIIDRTHIRNVNLDMSKKKEASNVRT